MKTPTKSAALALAILAGNALLSTCFAQGSLTPPGGEPTPVMKSLTQIEPRTPINATTTPGNSGSAHLITQPGSYYLESNLAVTNLNAISVTAADVTIDLRGFTISRAINTNGSAILVSGANCTIRDGSVRGFARGIDGQFALAGSVQLVTVRGFGDVAFFGNNGWRFTECTAGNATNATQAYGFSAGNDARFDRCQVINLSAPNLGGFGSGNRCIFTACIVGNLAGSGTGFSAYDNCAFYSCLASGVHGTTGGFGFSVNENCYFKDCQANDNGSSPGQGSSGGFWTADGVTMIDCLAEHNVGANSTTPARGGLGIWVYGTGLIQNCTVRANSGDGIYVGSGNVTGAKFINNVVEGNTMAGIHMVNGSGNVFEKNHLRGNGIGLHIATTANLIIGNTATANTTNYLIVTSNRYGPIVDLTGAGAASMSGNSAASTLVTTDPHANISY